MWARLLARFPGESEVKMIPSADLRVSEAMLYFDVANAVWNIRRWCLLAVYLLCEDAGIISGGRSNF